MTNTDKPAATRDRLISAMIDALQRRGLHGIGLTELLAAADAPKGVLYHHFPGGKTELAIAAIAQAAGQLVARLDQVIAARVAPAAVLQSWMAGAQRCLEGSGFERGCPLATVALESTAADPGIRAALMAAFAAIRSRLAVMLVATGVPQTEAASLAALIVSAYEGALMQARVQCSVAPLQETTEALVALLGTRSGVGQ